TDQPRPARRFGPAAGEARPFSDHRFRGGRLSPPAPLIFLIGARGSGKTTVARLLAERIGWAWLDSDEEIERRCGKTIREIFAAEGESGFRGKESALLTEFCRLQRHVIATGGGVVLGQANRALMREAGSVIWLQ